MYSDWLQKEHPVTSCINTGYFYEFLEITRVLECFWVAYAAVCGAND